MNEKGRSIQRIFKDRLLNGKPLELEQYSILMSYLQHENSSYWIKNGFFFVANTALLGFIFPIVKDSKAYGIFGLFPIAFGLIITFFWLRIMQGAENWINLIHSALVHLEEKAFPNIRVLKGRVGVYYNIDPGAPKSKIEIPDSIKMNFKIGLWASRTLKKLIYIFYIIWIFIGGVYLYLWWPAFRLSFHFALAYYFDIFFKFISQVF